MCVGGGSCCATSLWWWGYGLANCMTSDRWPVTPFWSLFIWQRSSKSCSLHEPEVSWISSHKVQNKNCLLEHPVGTLWLECTTAPTIDTMNENRIEILALSETCWSAMALQNLLYHHPSLWLHRWCAQCGHCNTYICSLLLESCRYCLSPYVYLNESYASATNVTYPMSLLLPSMPLLTLLLVPCKLQPLRILFTISCILWFQMIHLQVGCWFYTIDFNTRIGLDFSCLGSLSLSHMEWVTANEMIWGIAGLLLQQP